MKQPALITINNLFVNITIRHVVLLQVMEHAVKINTYIYAYIHTYIHAYIHAYTHTYVQTYTLASVHTKYQSRPRKTKLNITNRNQKFYLYQKEKKTE